MRFKLQPIPEYGAKRIKEWFAILPVEIDDEIRWLEKVKVLQMWISHIDGSHWENIKFLN